LPKKMKARHIRSEVARGGGVRAAPEHVEEQQLFGQPSVDHNKLLLSVPTTAG